MVRSPQGTVYVGTTNQKVVYALPDKNKDGRPDKVLTIAKNLNNPNGVAFKDGALYIAEIGKISRYDDIESHLENPPAPKVVNDELPDRAWHGFKYIRFGPDGLLYAPVGAPCNVGEQKDPRFASMLRMRADGSNVEIFAKGIRNTVGFDWHPKTRQLWFTDNGRDYLGDNLPPDELNCAPKKGLHFGFPYRYGMNVRDPEYGHKGTGQYVPPKVPLGPHVAALGMRFYTGKQFPEEYRNTIFICEHGSWNRSKRIGYRIMNVNFKPDGKPNEYKVFLQGWLENEAVWGRPVDLCLMPDGSMLVSDDFRGFIYRVSYQK